MPTVNTVAIEILKEMEKAIDDAEFVTRVEKRVSDSLDEIAIATDFNTFKTRSTFNTVIGQAQYQLPVGAREVIQFRHVSTGGTGEPIVYWTMQEAARRAARLEMSGKPRTWLEDGLVQSGGNTILQVRFAPVPDAIYSVEQEFYYFPTPFLSAQTLPIQDHFLPLVRRFVRASILRLEQKYDQADREQDMYNKLLDAIVKKERHKVASLARLKPQDLRRDWRRGQAVFPPEHFQNPWI